MLCGSPSEKGPTGPLRVRIQLLISAEKNPVRWAGTLGLTMPLTAVTAIGQSENEQSAQQDLKARTPRALDVRAKGFARNLLTAATQTPRATNCHLMPPLATGVSKG